ncbi:hypothetical protein [Paraburkholderia kirstenboschensis]|uniref:Uncharacterized protein n=1 Tax=Paraburkholderia kirstenboschensis TaxID=1245436 RepID=A0ABZ0ETV8_9BURK|nr:hypothetical protein [Paraburkholderia kirstenboschensis]WOD20561.1 hypothetical protein RW095_30800 [Paraburkholderia kirstenboschensis]
MEHEVAHFMTHVLKETKPKEAFTEHDMRAKCASDAETLERTQTTKLRNEFIDANQSE